VSRYRKQKKTTPAKSGSEDLSRESAQSDSWRTVIAPLRHRAAAAAGGVWMVWMMFLVVLAATTANPVVLNQLQIRRSSLIVSAQLVDPAGGRLTVKKIWHGEPTAAEIRVANLRDIDQAHAGKLCIVPLMRTSGAEYFIGAVPEAPERPVVYRETPEAIEQLKQILHDM
jgi:hypothetical protein